jgi:protein-glutamine gamma-glutamyltransferase
MKLASPLRALGNGTPMSADKTNILLLIASCALVLAPLARYLPLWVFPVCAALMAWRAWVTFTGSRLPSRWLLIAIALLAMLGVFWTFKTVFGRDAGVAMLTLLLSLKLLEIRAKRDLFVVLFLCFFLLLAGFFHSQSMGAAAFSLAAVITLLTTQVSYQYTGAMPSLARRMRLGASILGLALPLTLVLFVLFPRIQGPLWGLPLDAHSGRSGLSDTMSPGNIARLALSDAIAFRVKFSGALPTKPNRYWRGIVLGRYDGKNWTGLEARPADEHSNALALHGPATHYQVTLEPHGKRWLFALDMPSGVPHINGNPARLSSDMQLLASQPINNRVRYDATSHVDYQLHNNGNLPFNREPWLALPQGFNPRTLALAASLRRESSDEPQLVDSVLRMFREQEFRYTLEPPLLGEHVVDDFLFTTRAGFCEHYAGAFVVLMRAMGIPARVVTGYQGGDMNPADGFLVVRQSDAHAWAEVWLENRGWTRIDPTAAVAPERIELNLARAIPRTGFGGLIALDGSGTFLLAQLVRMRHSWDALGNSWNQWVLNYTSEKQSDLMRQLGFEKADWRTLAALMAMFGALILGLTLLLLAHRQRRRDPLEAIYAQLCRNMERRGLPRLPHEGPRAYGERLTGSDTPLGTTQKTGIARFLAHYEQLRYGPASAGVSVPLSTLKSLLRECR